MGRLTESGITYNFSMLDPAENKWLERVQKRLAAYEDTGLEPEEIKDILDRYRGFRSAISDETGRPMVSWGRAGQICRAEKEGRLVVLPCKVGDTAYVIRFENCLNGNCRWLENGKCVAKPGYCPKEIIPIKYDIKKHVGLHVYVTREEAEKALEGGRS